VIFCASSNGGSEAVACAGGGNFDINIIDCATSVSLAQLEGHTDQVSALAAASNSFALSSIFSASADGTVLLWDLRSRSCARRFGPFTAAVTSIAYDNTSGLLAVGMQTGAIEVMDIASGERVHRVTGHTAEVRSLDFGPAHHSGLLLSGSYDGRVAVSQVLDGNAVEVEVSPVAAHADKVRLHAHSNALILAKHCACVDVPACAFPTSSCYTDYAPHPPHPHPHRWCQQDGGQVQDHFHLLLQEPTAL
jgi:WD40 repeat protein